MLRSTLHQCSAGASTEHFETLSWQWGCQYFSTLHELYSARMSRFECFFFFFFFFFVFFFVWDLLHPLIKHQTT
ncbi:hypothetical protein VN97_g11828 [Penicillium thymicola]|uniref:Uncharacterized protein n=1 Tax=Penicillium thymicola TaxID=293382 RepID=A0AAI9T7F6_PENTH|nr:hypothetical protein VN97_g11828 [Penicillium thymicola]